MSIRGHHGLLLSASAGGPPPASDPYEANVIAYLFGELGDYVGSQFLDRTGLYWSNANVASVGDDEGSFNGTNAILAAAHADRAVPGSGDFTIEAEVTLPVDHQGILAATRGGFARGWSTILSLSDMGISGWNSAGSSIIANDTPTVFPSVGVRTHVAWVKVGNNWTMWVGGLLSNTATQTGAIDPGLLTSFLTVGADGTGFSDRWFKGIVHRLRITDGVARYTAPFNPADIPWAYTGFSGYFREVQIDRPNYWWLLDEYGSNYRGCSPGEPLNRYNNTISQVGSIIAGGAGSTQLSRSAGVNAPMLGNSGTANTIDIPTFPLGIELVVEVTDPAVSTWLFGAGGEGNSSGSFTNYRGVHAFWDADGLGLQLGTNGTPGSGTRRNWKVFTELPTIGVHHIFVHAVSSPTTAPTVYIDGTAHTPTYQSGTAGGLSFNNRFGVGTKVNVLTDANANVSRVQSFAVYKTIPSAARIAAHAAAV